MSISLNEELLDELGLGDLPVSDKNLMLDHIYETLETRVGMTLARRMTDSQLDEFETFVERKDEDGALAWLSTTFPDYKEVVGHILESLKAEITDLAPQIVGHALSAPESEG